MIAQKCMRRLWFVEDGETNVIFRGKGAKTKARQYATTFAPPKLQIRLITDAEWWAALERVLPSVDHE